MAILNYASSLGKVSNYIGMQVTPGTAGDYIQGEFAKLIFTGDGHIITHGIDYTPTFIGGNMRGLVPEAIAANGFSGSRLNFLSHDGKWKELSTAELPIAENFQVSSTDYIFNSKQVHDYFDAQISAVDAMRFRGEIKAQTPSTYPTSCEIGDTYRVTESGTYGGHNVKSGDLLICIAEGTGTETINSDAYWIAVEANINGTINHYINNVPFQVYTPNTNQGANSNDWFNIYAPVTGGTQGFVLVSTGMQSTPEWVSSTTLTAGNLTDDLKEKILSKVELTDNGTLVLTNLLGNTSNSTKATGTWDINITGVAGSVLNPLKLSHGLQYGVGDSYNGSEERTIRLMPASYGSTDATVNAAAIGGVIIDGIGMTNGKAKDGNTISITADGNIYINPENIANALGFIPGNTDNVFGYKAIFTSGADVTSAAPSVNPFFNLTATAEKDGSTEVVSSSQFLGVNDSIKIESDANGNLNFTLQTATDSMLGGIKVGFATDFGAKKYAVQLENDKAYVEVPWEDTSKSYSFIDVIDKAGVITALEALELADKFTLKAGTGMQLTVTDDQVITIHNEVYEVVSPAKMGYAPQMITTNTDTITSGYYMLAFTDTQAHPSWYRLPGTAFTDTWRSVHVNGTEVLTNTVTVAPDGTVTGTALNLVSGGKTSIRGNSATGDVEISSTWRDIRVEGQSIDGDGTITPAFNIRTSQDIYVHQDVTADQHTVSLEILWYNIDTNSYENDIVGN